MHVEEIQNIVEEKLMASNRKDVARTYINYRFLHDMARDQYDDLMLAIKEKVSASNVQNQNANVDEKSFGGRVGETSDLIMKKYALDYLVSDMARENHENNMIYIHDLSAYPVGSHNCLSVPFDDLLANGFNTRQTDVRPAQSVSTAFQLVAVIFQIQSLQQFGGVSATHIDHTMVPYVRKSFWKHFRDGMSWVELNNYSEIYTMKNTDADRSINDAFWG
jgi:ribonucleoside-triphosphate reductase